MTLLPAWMPRRQLLHLAYLSNLLWQPAFDLDRTWVDWAVVVVVPLVFVPLHLASCHPDRRVRERVLWATTALGVAATPLNAGASVLFVYAAVQASYLLGRRAIRWHLGLTALIGMVTLVSPIPMPYKLYAVLPAVAFIYIIGQQCIAEVEREQESERLRIDNVRIEQLATSAERERIGRDLHDLLGRSLTSLVVRAQLVQSLLPADPERAADAAGELEGTAREVLAQVRAAVGGLQEVSLAEELDGAHRTLAAAGLAVEVELPDALDPNPLAERCLALALRESVTNVVRHAEARTCRIALHRAGTAWRLEVADDGRGGAAPEGNGLRGMRERITAVGGVVERSGTAGTRVRVTVPA